MCGVICAWKCANRWLFLFDKANIAVDFPSLNRTNTCTQLHRFELLVERINHANESNETIVGKQEECITHMQPVHYFRWSLVFRCLQDVSPIPREWIFRARWTLAKYIWLLNSTLFQIVLSQFGKLFVLQAQRSACVCVCCSSVYARLSFAGARLMFLLFDGKSCRIVIHHNKSHYIMLHYFIRSQLRNGV